MWTPLDWAYIGGSYDALISDVASRVPHPGLYRPRKFDPEEAFYMMAKHGVRNLMAVPTVLRMMMHAVKAPPGPLRSPVEIDHRRGRDPGRRTL
jgi:acetyl-CoA synthetase